MLVSLSFDEHTLAHELRATVYESLGDTMATNFRKGVDPKEVQRMANASMVNPQVKETLGKDIVLKHPDLDHVVVIPGGTAVLPVELLPILLNVLPENSKFREKLVKATHKSFSYSASVFLRKDTSKKSCYGFYHKDAVEKPIHCAKDDIVVKQLISPAQRLKEKMVWSHPHLEENLIFPPNSIKQMIDLQDIFLEALPFSSPSWEKVKNCSNFTNNVSRVIKGERTHFLNFRLVKN